MLLNKHTNNRISIIIDANSEDEAIKLAISKKNCTENNIVDILIK